MTWTQAPSFTQVMSDHDDLTRRLGELGAAPAPDVRADHLHAMRTAAADAVLPAPRRGFGRLAVAGAAVVGFLVGSTGFAMAGALPDPAQGVAHDVLSVVQVDVPDRPDNRGACISAAARQHGDDEAAKQAAKDACPEGGRPDGVGPEGRRGRPGGLPGAVDADGDPCTGPPPWAGTGRGPEAREKATRAACAGAEGEDPAADALEEQREAEEEARQREAEALEERQEQGPETPEQHAEPPTADTPPAETPTDPEQPTTDEVPAPEEAPTSEG